MIFSDLGSIDFSMIFRPLDFCQVERWAWASLENNCAFLLWLRLSFFLGGNLLSCESRQMWEKTLLRCTKFLLPQVVSYTIPVMSILICTGQARNNLWPEEGATTQYFDHILPLHQPTVYETIGKWINTGLKENKKKHIDKVNPNDILMHSYMNYSVSIIRGFILQQMGTSTDHSQALTESESPIAPWNPSTQRSGNPMKQELENSL